MKYLILGQPRSGKSTLAKMISEELNIPIICADFHRNIWGFNESGYDTGISPVRKQEFYDKLLKDYNDYADIILEGSSISPRDIDMFPNDGVVLLYKNTSAENMLELSRKYDFDWTTEMSDEDLLGLFTEYQKFSKDWVDYNPNIAVDTTNFEAGLEIAKNKLCHRNIKRNY